MIPADDGALPDGWRHFPQSYSEEFFKQLTAEKVRIEYIRGQEVRRYRNEERVRNEALDLSVYNLGAFRLRQWNFDAIAEDLEAQAKAARDGKPPPCAEPKSPRRRVFMAGFEEYRNWHLQGPKW